MLRLFVVGLAGVALSFVATAEVLAQGNASTKAQRDYGRGFTQQRQYGGQYYPRRSYSAPAPAGESYRSFSYEPAAESATYSPGAKVVVPQGARMMLGDKQVGDLSEGQQFTITEAKRGWLGVAVQKEGEQVLGWVWRGDVSSPAMTPDESTPAETYQRFSYEPVEAPMATQFQSAAPRYQTMGPRFRSSGPSRNTSPPEVRLHPGTRRY